MYTESDVKRIIDKQREFFRTGKTLDLDFRIRQLKRLKKAVIDHRKVLEEALVNNLDGFEPSVRCE